MKKKIIENKAFFARRKPNNPLKAFNNEYTFSKKRSFPYKKLSLIDQFVCLLYAIVLRYRRLRQISNFLGWKERVQIFRTITQKLRDSNAVSSPLNTNHCSESI